MAQVSTTQCFTVVVERTFLELKEETLEEFFCEGRPRSFSEPCVASLLPSKKCSSDSFDDDAQSSKATTLGSSQDWTALDSDITSAISFNDGEIESSVVSTECLPPGVWSTAAAASVPMASAIPGVWNSQDSSPVAAIRQFGAPRTSLILQNIPVGCTRAELQGFLDSHGFYAQYDLLYLPTNFWTWKNCGYAFVNMVSHGMATMVMQRLHGFEGWCAEGVDALEVSFSTIQGVEANIERYRNSPVMHHLVPDEYKPLLLVGGQQVAFPAPDRKVKTPPALKNSLQR